MFILTELVVKLARVYYDSQVFIRDLQFFYEQRTALNVIRLRKQVDWLHLLQFITKRFKFLDICCKSSWITRHIYDSFRLSTSNSSHYFSTCSRTRRIK